MSKLKSLDSLPKKIKVLGIEFEIKLCTLKDEFGDCTIDTRLIRVDKHQGLDQALITVWHEAIHAALAVSGLNELLAPTDGLEEAIVRCLEHSFADIVDIYKLAIDK